MNIEPVLGTLCVPCYAPLISQSYDVADHPVDIEETWQLVASSDNQDEAPTSFSVTCSGAPTLFFSSKIIHSLAAFVVASVDSKVIYLNTFITSTIDM